MTATRRIAAILAAVFGYSHLVDGGDGAVGRWASIVTPCGR
jgi:hypothetical protein